MKTIARRITKLEERFAPRIDHQTRSIVEAIRESRRRRLAAEGREPEPDPPKRSLVDARDPPLTLSEAFRRARLERYARMQTSAEVATAERK